MKSNLEHKPLSEVIDMLESLANTHDLLLSQNLIDFADDVWHLATNQDKGKEDRHIQFHLEGKDYDLILRADDTGQEYKSFDIFDYQAQEYKAKGTI